MSLVRRAVAVACFVALAAVDSSAFKFEIHVAITNEALGEVVANLPANLKQMLQTVPGVPITSFSNIAIREIGNANKARDTGDCGNRDDVNVAAVPCTSWTSESKAAFDYLSMEPASDHFDNEAIQVSSNQISVARNDILAHLRAGRYVAARKVLGGALHAIQDFYSHTNYVEIGYRIIESRIGTGDDSFSQGIPRLARSNEPVCVQVTPLLRDPQEFLITQLSQENKQKLINAADKLVEENNTLLNRTRRDAIKNVIADRPLTSGHFFFPGDSALSIAVMLFLPNNGDPSEITDLGKCRHGWQAGVVQPGINKDGPERPGHAEARKLAKEHTMRFIVDIMREIRASDPDYMPEILGLMGHERGTRVIESVRVGVPGAPNGESWDTALGSALGFFVRGTQGLKNIQPDVLVCVESAHLPGTCANVCEDTDWSIDLNAYVCAQPVGPTGVLYEPDLRVLVREVDFGQPRRVIASFRVEDPAKCDPFCSLALDPDRTIWIQFQFKLVSRYSWRSRTTPPVTFPPIDGIPIATPSSGGGSPSRPSASPPPSGAPGWPSAPAPSGTTASVPASASGSFAPPANPNARTVAPSSAARLRTPEAIDTSLGLRDADSCTGADLFFPQGTVLARSPLGQQLGQDQTNRLYQAAAFAMAVSDTATKQNVLNAIQSKVGDDAFFGAMTLVIGDIQQSRTIVAAYQEVSKYLVGKVVSTGLNQMLQPPRPPSALAPEVDRWILKRLATAPLVSEAVDRMFTGPQPISAECTINQLAKDGFTDVVNGR